MIITWIGGKYPRRLSDRWTASPFTGRFGGKLARPLGLRKSAELAILAIELPPHLPMVKLKTLLRLVPGGNRGRYGTTIG